MCWHLWPCCARARSSTVSSLFHLSRVTVVPDEMIPTIGVRRQGRGDLRPRSNKGCPCPLGAQRQNALCKGENSPPNPSPSCEIPTFSAVSAIPVRPLCYFSAPRLSPP